MGGGRFSVAGGVWLPATGGGVRWGSMPECTAVGRVPSRGPKRTECLVPGRRLGLGLNPIPVLEASAGLGVDMSES